MAKRKRDVFTVREAVPNWFEASEEVSESSGLVCVSAETHEDRLKDQQVAQRGSDPDGHVGRYLRGTANEAGGRSQSPVYQRHVISSQLGRTGR